jgi:type VI secretion system protein ImpM
MPDRAVSGAAFVFGKLPAHGDFVARGLSVEAREAWDAWLAQEMADAKAAHGATFAERFVAAPVWRFVGTEAVGALAPSADSVGRHFPIVAGVAAGAAAVCEDRLYDALVEGWTADQLHLALTTTEGPAGDVGKPMWWTLGNERFAEAQMDGERPHGLITTMLTAVEAA